MCCTLYPVPCTLYPVPCREGRRATRPAVGPLRDVRWRWCHWRRCHWLPVGAPLAMTAAEAEAGLGEQGRWFFFRFVFCIFFCLLGGHTRGGGAVVVAKLAWTWSPDVRPARACRCWMTSASEAVSKPPAWSPTIEANVCVMVTCSTHAAMHMPQRVHSMHAHARMHAHCVSLCWSTSTCMHMHMGGWHMHCV